MSSSLKLIDINVVPDQVQASQSKIRSTKQLRELEKQKKFEVQILKKLSISRKADNYNNLKIWDKHRAQDLSNHYSIITEIKSELEKREKYSNEYMSTILNFLLAKNQQYKNYAITLNQNTHRVEAQLLSIVIDHKKPFIDLSRQRFNKIKSSHIQIIQYVNNSQYQIRQNMQDSKKQIDPIRHNYEILVERLYEQNQQTEEKCKKLSRQYHKTKQQNTFRSEIDFYQQQKRFIQKTKVQTETQNELGLQIIKWLDVLIQIEIDRCKLLRTIRVRYCQLCLEISKFVDAPALLEIIRHQDQNVMVLNSYSFCSLLSSQSQKHVKRTLGATECIQLGLIQLKQYLSKILTTDLDLRNLILKQSKTIFRTEQGNLIQTFITITIDGFMHVNIRKDSQDSEIVIKLSKNCKVIHQNEIELKIKSGYQQSWLNYFNKQQEALSLTIIFENEDQKLQFCQFIQKIIY